MHCALSPPGWLGHLVGFAQPGISSQALLACHGCLPLCKCQHGTSNGLGLETGCTTEKYPCAGRSPGGLLPCFWVPHGGRSPGELLQHPANLDCLQQWSTGVLAATRALLADGEAQLFYFILKHGHCCQGLAVGIPHYGQHPSHKSSFKVVNSSYVQQLAATNSEHQAEGHWLTSVCISPPAVQMAT